MDLSGKLDGSIVELFQTIADTTESLSIPFFVVGATVRDIILTNGYGIRTIRATYDIDLGVKISGWQHYQKLTEGLIATGKLESDKKEPQRLKYKGSLLIDIIPFGAISDPDDSLSWPPDQEIEMSTLGFKEAYDASITVRLRAKPILDIQFASLPGLALMKIISWNDRYPSRSWDAKDLSFLMRNYLDAGNQERLFNEEADLAEEEDFDYLRAGARLLGRDIAAISNMRTIGTVLEILEKETGERDRYRLVEDMRDISSALDNDFDQNLQLLEDLKSGIRERLKE